MLPCQLWVATLMGDGDDDGDDDDDDRYVYRGSDCQKRQTSNV